MAKQHRLEPSRSTGQDIAPCTSWLSTCVGPHPPHSILFLPPPSCPTLPLLPSTPTSPLPSFYSFPSPPPTCSANRGAGIRKLGGNPMLMLSSSIEIDQQRFAAAKANALKPTHASTGGGLPPRIMEQIASLQVNHTTPHHTTTCDATPRHAAPRRATPRRATPRHAAPRRATPRHVTSRRAAPHHATSRHVTPRHATPCYTSVELRSTKSNPSTPYFSRIQSRGSISRPWSASARLLPFASA